MLELRAIAKVELHRHLEGSLRPATMLELFRAHGLPLPAETAEALAERTQVRAPMGDLLEVLAAFDVFQRAFVSPEAAERLAYEAVEDAARENVRLLELRFSPEFMAAPHRQDPDALTAAVIRGARRAGSEHRVAVGLIAIVSRGLGLESAERTASLALRFRDQLCGFDLADDEVRFPSRLFAGAVRRVREAGLPITVHSGESTGPDHVQQTLDSLLPRRLGHGVAVAADPELIARTCRERIALEMCPTSNEHTRAVPSLAEHPARALLRRGVPVTINSDDPGLFGIDLTHELRLAREVLGFSDAELALATHHALEASFLEPSLKAQLRREFFGWVDRALAPAGPC